MPAKVRLRYAVPILIVTVVAVVTELWLTAFIGFGLLIWMMLAARRQQARPPDAPEA